MRAVEKRLRERIKFLESEIVELKADRDKFRDFMVRDLRSAIIHIRDNTYTSGVALVEIVSKRMGQVKWWYWS